MALITSEHHLYIKKNNNNNISFKTTTTTYRQEAHQLLSFQPPNSGALAKCPLLTVSPAPLRQSGSSYFPVKQRRLSPLPFEHSLLRGTGKGRNHPLSAASSVYSCLLAGNPTYSVMRCSLAGFHSTVPVGMEMLELWYHCCSTSPTGFI